MKPHELGVEDYSDMVRMFHAESDRGAAVLAASYIENYLAGYIKAFMVSDADIDKLFSQFGPLSSFSQRIEISYAFGVIGKPEYKELHLIRKIRNHFAHHPKEAAFDAPPVKDWVDNLMTAGAYALSDGAGEFKMEDRKLIYLISTGMFVVNAENTLKRKGL